VQTNPRALGENPRALGTNPRAGKKGTRIPEPWLLTDELRAWAARHAAGHAKDYADLDVDDQVERFIDHFRAAPGRVGVKLNWAATWRNWWRKAPEMTRGNGNGKAYETPYDRIMRVNADDAESPFDERGTTVDGVAEVVDPPDRDLRR